MGKRGGGGEGMAGGLPAWPESFFPGLESHLWEVSAGEQMEPSSLDYCPFPLQTRKALGY